jgi:hypothetical protein
MKKPALNLLKLSVPGSIKIKGLNRMSVTFFLSCFILMFLPIHAQGLEDVKVTAEMDEKTIYENQPAKGLLSITHDKNVLVNPLNFRMNGKPFAAEFIQDIQISPSNPLVISYYRFYMPGQPAGLYLLPEVEVVAGGRTYTSIPSSYQVKGAKKPEPGPPPSPPKNGSSNSSSPPPPSLPPPSPPLPQKNSSEKSVLKLELNLEATQLLYPKQRIRATYRFLFNNNIALSEENLPLLSPEGFNKVGTKETTSYQTESFSVQQFSQVLEADKPGDYHLPVSSIAGYAYTIDAAGDPVYQKTLLSSSVPSITLKVVPFPEHDRPASFNGAIGPFNGINAFRSSSDAVLIGNKIFLNMEINGKGQVDNAPMPELCCQPGFSGIFLLGDLPPIEEVLGDIKRYRVEMRPLIASTSTIPSIEFSYFLPDQGKYEVLHSLPIPITIQALPNVQNGKEQSTTPFLDPRDSSDDEWRLASKQLPPIEISGNLSLKPSDLRDLPFGTWDVFWLIPLGLVVIISERYLRHRSKRITILCLMSILPIPLFSLDGDSSVRVENALQGAYNAYLRGENSKTIAGRKQGFNQALEIYLQLEQDYHPLEGNGALYFDIANSYFQLGEYPLSIFYYYRAWALMPRNPECLHNLTIALKKLHLPPPEQRWRLSHLFFLSLPERLRIFFIIGLFLVSCIGLYIWRPNWTRITYGIIFFGVSFIFLILNLGYTRYLEPISGILIKASTLYREAGQTHSKITDQPVSAGLKVEVVNVQDKGRWLKIITPEGTMGYVPMENIRLI